MGGRAINVNKHTGRKQAPKTRKAQLIGYAVRSGCMTTG